MRRETETDGELIGSPRAAVELAHVTFQPNGEDGGALWPSVAHQHRVFVAANPRHQVRVAKGLSEDSGGVSQCTITHRVTRPVIDMPGILQVGASHEPCPLAT